MSHNLLLNTEIDILVLLLVACLAAIAFKKINFFTLIPLVNFFSNPKRYGKKIDKARSN